jgi:exopolyphosphatase/guanosine-5'-triphosphate,3'-diphosphate pyrophosphatase
MPEEPHRVGVLDVGCFSAHLVVVDRDEGSLLRPVLSHKVRLRLDKAIDSSGRISRDGIVRIAAAVHEAQQAVRRLSVSTVVPFATSVIRDAANADDVVGLVATRTGVELRMLPGRQEARLAYLAARHWFGWSAGPLAVLDVGGGTVEMAAGEGTEPLFAHSLPLGARTLTRTWASEKLTGKRLRRTTADVVQAISADLPADSLAESRRCRAVGCSKVFQQLARLAGARSQRDGQFVARRLHAADLTRWIPRLAKLSAAERAQLPGISEHRAHQSLAGAIAAQALMTATGHEVLDICPWSTKEGLLITLLEQPAHHAGGDVIAVA